MSFAGFVALDASIRFTFVTVNASSVPTQADSLPLARVYSPAGTLMNAGVGSAALKDTGLITGATNATPIVITSAAHKLETGTRVTVASVGGNTAANSTWTITKVSSSTFSLDTSVGNGAYTSGGTWSVTGLYDFALTPTSANAYAPGQTYTVLIEHTVSTVTKIAIFTFAVV